MGMKRATRKKTMQFRPTLFWDVDPSTIDTKKHARYIIERILDFGNDDEVRWMARNYPTARIKDVLNEPRSPIHAKSKSLWSLIYR